MSSTEESQELFDLPAEFLERLHRIVPEQSMAEVLHTFTQVKTTSFRVNTVKAQVEPVLRSLEEARVRIKPVDWCDYAFYVKPHHRRRLTTSDAAMDGLIYPQNLSSMLTSIVLDPQPGETVLDIASAPGGKSLHMVALMQNEGWLSAVDSVRKRFFILKERLENQGATIAHCYCMDGRDVGRKTPERFDRVMVDAPCSSESRFSRRRPAALEYWSLKKVQESSRKQKSLFRSAFDALKPGGRLMYCTCTFAPEENEMVVDHMLRRLGDAIEVLPFELPIENVQGGITEWGGKQLNPSVAMSRRILPTFTMNSMFMCLMRKTGAAS